MSVITPDQFTDILDADFKDIIAQDSIAVGLSGGPDSLALTALLSDWSLRHDGPDIHALIVDHALRPESAEEARGVMSVVRDMPKIRVKILTCGKGDIGDTRKMEEARAARYALIADYCTSHKIRYLFLGHHADDQAETVLFRLAKGSGLDGLGGMSPLQARGDIVLCRPLLGIGKQDLVDICAARNLEHVADPSNKNPDYARPRMRQSMNVLAEEGLSTKRLVTTAMRLSRARDALDHIAEEAFAEIVLAKDTKRIVLNLSNLAKRPMEIVLRVIMIGMNDLVPFENYAPRMEKIEDLACDLMAGKPFRKRTLGGVVFERDDKNGQLVLQKEFDN